MIGVRFLHFRAVCTYLRILVCNLILPDIDFKPTGYLDPFKPNSLRLILMLTTPFLCVRIVCACACIFILQAIPSYQRRPSSLKKMEGNVRFPTNLHVVRRSARPMSRWAPKAHCMMGKTQWRHCERSFGTNVLVLGKERDKFPLLSKPLKTDVNKNVVIERFLN